MSLSIIIPTYKEANNLHAITQSISDALACVDFPWEILFMDDNSEDGSIEIAADLLHHFPVRLITRTQDKGLSQSVIHGFSEAAYKHLIVMDADLSHPATAIPQLYEKLANGEANFVIGSRYVDGGALDSNWGWFRRLNSYVATWLALPLVKVSDPMSGFFGISKSSLPELHRLSPIGYKIGLEVLVKGEYKNIYEHPIHFQDRQFGESKMTFNEQLRYLRHLRRLYQYRFTTWAELFQFALVGASGFVIDLSFYLLLQVLFSIPHQVARAISFWPAATWNWFLNRTITFSHRNKRPPLLQWAEFCTSSLLGFTINVGSYQVLTSYVPFFTKYPVITLITGVLCGMGFNFLFSNVFVFKQLRDEEPGKNGYTKF